MIVLHIEHLVSNFDTWKASFDSYGALRQQGGVRRYRIARLTNNPNSILIDLEFDGVREAETLLSAVQQVWQRVGGALITDPRWEISEVVEAHELSQRAS